MPLDELDLELAWKRVKHDRPDRCFVAQPHLLRLVDSDLEGWLNRLRGKVVPDYTPHDCAICECPKAGWLVRPGALLHIEDEVVFNAIVGQCYSGVWERIGPMQGSTDVGSPLQQPGEVEWVRRGFQMWSAWQEKSIEMLENGASYVLFADIAAFYENIDLPRMLSDMREAGIDDEAHGLLSKCLHRWAHPRGQGVPQGYSASDILAKLYMRPVDQGLRNNGFTHLRYVDDIRIFCETSLQAKQALLLLNRLLRIRGLNVQSAKTVIYEADQARSEINGVAPRIQGIQRQMERELTKWNRSADPYGPLEAEKPSLEQPDGSPAVEVVERAFADNFLGSLGEFDKSLFHYLLNRLGTDKSPAALGYCLDALRTRPEETEPILRYLHQIGLPSEAMGPITHYMKSSQAIYDYQLYQVVEWCRETGRCNSEVVSACRGWAFDRNRPSWLRASCLAVIGTCGDAADLDGIEGEYARASNEIQKTEVVLSIGRMEPGRRNAFLGRVQNDGELVRRAVLHVKSS